MKGMRVLGFERLGNIFKTKEILFRKKKFKLIKIQNNKNIKQQILPLMGTVVSSSVRIALRASCRSEASGLELATIRRLIITTAEHRLSMARVVSAGCCYSSMSAPTVPH